MIERGSALPDSYINPSLPLYLGWPVVALQSRAAEAGLLPGHAGNPLLALRLLSAIAASLSVVVLARWAPAPLASRAALLLALSPLAVNVGHFATPEPWLLLGTTATLVLAVAHAEGRAPAWALGMALGLTASTKYTAAALVVPALVAACWRRRERGTAYDVALAAGAGIAALAVAIALSDTLAARLHLPDARLLQPEHAVSFVRGARRAAAVGAIGLMALAAARTLGLAQRVVRPEPFVVLAVAAVAFVAGTPGAVLEPIRFLSDLGFNHQTRFEYKGLAGASSAWLPYAGLLAWAAAPLTLAAALAGLVLAARQRSAALVLPATAVACAYVLVASSGHAALRFLVPALPAVAWLAAAALGWAPAGRVRRVAIAAVVIGALLPTALLVRLFFVDSRLRAERWMDRNVPLGATIDLIANDSGYAPSAPRGRTLRHVRTLSREMAPPEVFRTAAGRFSEEGSGWVVTTAAYYQRFLDHPDQQPDRAAFFRDLLGGRRGYEVAARFRQPWWLRPPAEFLDPEIVVLRRRMDGASSLGLSVPAGGGPRHAGRAPRSPTAPRASR